MFNKIHSGLPVNQGSKLHVGQETCQEISGWIRRFLEKRLPSLTFIFNTHTERKEQSVSSLSKERVSISEINDPLDELNRMKTHEGDITDEKLCEVLNNLTVEEKENFANKCSIKGVQLPVEKFLSRSPKEIKTPENKYTLNDKKQILNNDGGSILPDGTLQMGPLPEEV